MEDHFLRKRLFTEPSTQELKSLEATNGSMNLPLLAEQQIDPQHEAASFSKELSKAVQDFQHDLESCGLVLTNSQVGPPIYYGSSIRTLGDCPPEKL